MKMVLQHCVSNSRGFVRSIEKGTIIGRAAEVVLVEAAVGDTPAPTRPADISVKRVCLERPTAEERAVELDW